MKGASQSLGISYNILYGKYREMYGPLSKKSASRHKKIFENGCLQDVNSFDLKILDLNIIEYNEYTGTRQEFWQEHYVEVLLRVSTKRSKLHYLTISNALLKFSGSP